MSTFRLHHLRYLGFLLLLMAGLQVNAQSIALEEFIAYPQYEDARISPDGEHLALVVDDGTFGHVLVLALEDMSVVGSFRSEDNAGIYKAWWVTDERLLFSTYMKGGSLGQPFSNADIYGVNLDGSELMGLAGMPVGEFNRYDLLHVLPEDDSRVLLMREPGMGFGGPTPPAMVSIDVNRQPRPERSGTRSTGSSLGRSPAESPLSTGRLLTDDEGNMLAAYGRENDAAMRVQLRPDGGSWQPLSEVHGEAAAARLAAATEIVGLSGDEALLYFLEPSEEDTTALSGLDMNSGEMSRLFAHDSYDFTVEDLVWSSDGAEIIGVKFIGMFPEAHYFSSHPEVVLHQQLDAAFPQQQLRMINFSADGSIALAEVTGDSVADSLYLLDRNQNELRALTSTYPGLPAEQMALVEPVIIEARDGLQLEGYLTRPRDAVDGEGALVVLPHDQPFTGRDSFLFDPVAQLLVNRGYSVLQVNYRGSTGYGADFAAAGQDAWHSAMIDDIADATRWVMAAGITEEGRACIVGSDYAAYAAMVALARYPELYRCAVAEGGLYDLSLVEPPEMEEGGGPMAAPMPAPVPGGFTGMVMGMDEDIRQARSVMPLAEQVQGAVMLVHGGMDMQAPVAQAHALEQALRDERVSVEALIIDDERHGFMQPENRQRHYSELLSFLGAEL